MLESFLRRMSSTRESSDDPLVAPNELSAITLVHIVAASYSGSTWFNLMLGSHGNAFSVGELFWITDLGRPYCAFHGDACPIWSRLPNVNADQLMPNLADLTGKQTMVVNNSMGFVDAAKSAGIRTRHVHLIRDGRAVTASYLRKHPDQSVRDACRWWSEGVRHQMRRLGRKPKGDVLRVRYENLCAYPESELRKVCQWLAQDFDAPMLAYDKRVSHFIGGNLGTLSMVARAQNLPSPTEPPDMPPNLRTPIWDLQHYAKQTAESFKHSRWDDERTESDRKTFDKLAGGLNRQLGYE